MKTSIIDKVKLRSKLVLFVIYKLLKIGGKTYVYPFKGYKIYFKNFNTLGIIEKNISEIDSSIEKIYKETDLFIDVGAHIGIKSILFGLLNKKAKIFAFEPCPETYEFLKLNLSQLKKTTIKNIALSNKKGEVIINYDINHLDVSSIDPKFYYLNKNSGGYIRSCKVKSDRLDNIFRNVTNKNIYLKIDVESFENQVLLGGEKLLGKIKFLDIEICQNSIKSFSDTINILAKTNKKYNVHSIDIYKDRFSAYPHAVNLLIEFT